MQNVEDEPRSETAQASLAEALMKAGLAGDPELAQLAEALRAAVAGAAKPEFTMIRLFSDNQPQGSEPWLKIRDDEFERRWEFAADPVFDVMVENNSGNTVVIYRVGVHILERKPGTGARWAIPNAWKCNPS